MPIITSKFKRGSKIAISARVSLRAMFLCFIFIAPLNSGCKERKDGSNAIDAGGVQSSSETLEKAAQLAGRRTVDSWYLAGDDYSRETSSRSDGARRGRDLWFFATGGNARFFHRTLAERLGGRVDWNKFLGAPSRGQRFEKWGGISDPDCRPPQNDRETALGYGWDVCPGDVGTAGLFNFIGKSKSDWEQQDPACKFRERDAADVDFRSNPCALAFGTSTGVVGFRKFPNPNFQPNKWPGWSAYDASDFSIEPPFIVGLSCASCHAGFDPENSPEFPEKPTWKNIQGLIGNRYLKFGELLGSGIKDGAVTKEYLNALRPGVFHHLPEFDVVAAKVNSPPSAIPLGVAVVFEGDEDKQQRIKNSIQKTGVCFESCKFKAESFDSECLKSCEAWRSFSGRIGDLEKYADFVVSPEVGKAHDLSHSKYIDLFVKGGRVAWENGQKLFSENCSSCHSGTADFSDQPSRDLTDLSAKDFFMRNREGSRVDVLSDGGFSSALTIGGSRCSSRRELSKNTSLVGLWSKAPLFNNRSLGAAYCSSGIDRAKDCDKNDPSVASRIRWFDHSLDQLLFPETRHVGAVLTEKPILKNYGPPRYTGDALTILFPKEDDSPGKNIASVQVIFPVGTPFTTIRNFEGDRWYAEVVGHAAAKTGYQNGHLYLKNELATKIALAATSYESFLEVFGPWIRCTEESESKGHERFIPTKEADRLDLKAFLQTL